MRFDLHALFVSFDPRVDVGIEGNQESIGLILVKDLDPRGVIFMVKEMDIFFDQFHGGFIDSPMEGDRSVTVDLTLGPDAKEVREVFRSRSQEVKVLSIPVPGCFSCRAMNGSMIGLVTPSFEPFVEVGQR